MTTILTVKQNQNAFLDCFSLLATDDFETTVTEDLANVASDNQKNFLEQPEFTQNDKTLNDFVTLNAEGK